jgi:hypothetical protein
MPFGAKIHPLRVGVLVEIWESCCSKISFEGFYKVSHRSKINGLDQAVGRQDLVPCRSFSNLRLPASLLLLLSSSPNIAA